MRTGNLTDINGLSLQRIKIIKSLLEVDITKTEQIYLYLGQEDTESISIGDIFIIKNNDYCVINKNSPHNLDVAQVLQNKSNYDSQKKGFTFLATDTGDLYFKLSDNIGDWSEPIFYAGKNGYVEGNYLDVYAQNDYITVSNKNIPVAIEIQNKIYDIDENIQQDENNGVFKIPVYSYLAKHNVTSYDGAYRVWFAGGIKGEKGDIGQIGPSNVLSIGTVQKGDIASATITGESPSQVLNLVLPKGDQGEQGPKGDPGEVLQNNFIQVNSVTGEYIVIPTTNVPVKVQIDNIIYDMDDCPIYVDYENNQFKIPVHYFLILANKEKFEGTWKIWMAGGRAFKYEDFTQNQLNNLTGPSNVLSIGTVQKGDTASATITGESPSQVLNLVLPKGDKGEPGQQGDIGQTGPSNVLSIGTVESGEVASATITGESPSQALNLVLPKGDKGQIGEQGPSNVLSIGTVESGDEASATITGESPSQTLNLVLPKGDKGQKGDPGVATYIYCICTVAPKVIYQGMVWIKGGSAQPVYASAIGAIQVLTQTPSDIVAQKNGTIIIKGVK